MANQYTNLNQDNAIHNSITRFTGFYENIYRDPFIGGTAFVFVTKPLLFIDPIKPNVGDYKKILAYENMTRDPVFTQYIKSESLNFKDDKIIASLSYNTDYSRSSFLPIFTNECKDFNSNGVSMGEMSVFDTKQGFTQPLPTHKTNSEAASELSISVTEDSNLTFTKMLTLWVNYISNITDGTFNANPEMVMRGALDYTCSIFYFVLEPDGRTLKYWCKYTGCWPSNIPYEALKYSKGQHDTIDLDINFKYTIKEDMNPRILEEFNILSFRLAGTSITHISNEYAAITESPLLNRDILLNSGLPNVELILKAPERDPIILFRSGDNRGSIADKKDNRFELIFDDFGYKSSVLDGIFNDSTSYINDLANNTAKQPIENIEWNLTDFWKDFGD